MTVWVNNSICPKWWVDHVLVFPQKNRFKRLESPLHFFTHTSTHPDLFLPDSISDLCPSVFSILGYMLSFPSFILIYMPLFNQALLQCSLSSNTAFFKFSLIFFFFSFARIEVLRISHHPWDIFLHLKTSFLLLKTHRLHLYFLEAFWTLHI